MSLALVPHWPAVSTGDGSGPDTEEEMKWALIVLSIILCIFLCICSCQCYQKFMFEIFNANPSNDSGNKKKAGSHHSPKGSFDVMLPLEGGEQSQMPCAPYVRDVSNV